MQLTNRKLKKGVGGEGGGGVGWEYMSSVSFVYLEVNYNGEVVLNFA